MRDRKIMKQANRFKETTTGAGPGSGFGPSTFAPVPPAIITSDTCGLNLAVGYLRNIFVVHSTIPAPFSAACPTDAIYVYRANANGNAAPIQILHGPATHLNQPYGIYEGR